MYSSELVAIEWEEDVNFRSWSVFFSFNTVLSKWTVKGYNVPPVIIFLNQGQTDPMGNRVHHFSGPIAIIHANLKRTQITPKIAFFQGPKGSQSLPPPLFSFVYKL